MLIWDNRQQPFINLFVRSRTNENVAILPAPKLPVVNVSKGSTGLIDSPASRDRLGSAKTGGLPGENDFSEAAVQFVR